MHHTVQHWVDWVVRRNNRKDPFTHERLIEITDEDPVTILVGSRPNGVRITLPNGLTVSIQWTKHNYCSRRSADLKWEDPHDAAGSVDAEVAIWNMDGKYYRLSEHGDVIGWQSVAEVEDLLDRACKDTNFAPLSNSIRDE